MGISASMSHLSAQLTPANLIPDLMFASIQDLGR